MEKFQNKYRIPSARLQNWDYGSNAAYFITICTEYHVNFFGEIIGRDAIHRVSLTTPGEIAHSIWLEIPDHFPYAELDVQVVMPNHVHGIIIIDKTNDDKINNDVTGNMSVGTTVDAINRVSTTHPTIRATTQPTIRATTQPTIRATTQPTTVHTTQPKTVRTTQNRWFCRGQKPDGQ